MAAKSARVVFTMTEAQKVTLDALCEQHSKLDRFLEFSKTTNGIKSEIVIVAFRSFDFAKDGYEYDIYPDGTFVLDEEVSYGAHRS